MTLYQRRVLFVFLLMLTLFVGIPLGSTYAFPRETTLGVPWPFLETKLRASKRAPIDASNELPASTIRARFFPLGLLGDLVVCYVAAAAAARIWGQTARRP